MKRNDGNTQADINRAEKSIKQEDYNDWLKLNVNLLEEQFDENKKGCGINHFGVNCGELFGRYNRIHYCDNCKIKNKLTFENFCKEEYKVSK